MPMLPLTESELEDLWEWAEDDEGMHMLVRLAIEEIRARRAADRPKEKP